MTHAVECEQKLALLHKRLRLDLTVNELRIMVGCLKAVEYLMRIDDEPYLDADALELKQRLERRYADLLGENDGRGTS